MKQELLNKLNKKDKEEYIDKYKKIWGKNNLCLGLVYVNSLFYYCFFLAIAIPLWFIAFEVNHPILLLESMRLFFIFGKVIIYMILFGFLIDYIFLLIKLRRSSRLKKEYFDITPKRK